MLDTLRASVGQLVPSGSTNVGLESGELARTLPDMNKRKVATLLWFAAGWTLGLMLAWAADLPSLVGPAMAALFAVVVWWDPTGRLWDKAR